MVGIANKVPLPDSLTSLQPIHPLVVMALVHSLAFQRPWESMDLAP